MSPKTPLPDPLLLDKYSGPVPRYTSYPTAPHFGAQVNDAVVTNWLQALPDQTASVYIHMLYCKQLCLYCGCNMKVTNNKDVVADYVRTLMAEIDHVSHLIPQRQKVGTIHLGGGTPSYCPPAVMEALFEALNQHFDIAADAEISMEIDPRQLTDDMVLTMAKLGFNRVSFGIQDTNELVQRAIMRVQPQELNLRATQAMRAAGINGINVDLLYGLPKQSVETMKQTVIDVLKMAPQRIALFGYAHVPWMKKHQAVLERYHLPDSQERLDIFNTAVEALEQAGYIQLGIDHFCLPDDPLAIAYKQKAMHRNFMGYTTDAAPILLGFGASAISQYPQGYAQNVSASADYSAAIDNGSLPIARGIAITDDDAMRRGVIESLLCTMQVDLPTADYASLVVNHDTLSELMRDGLVEWHANAQRMTITEKGQPFARVVAACFDTYLKPEEKRHSRAV